MEKKTEGNPMDQIETPRNKWLYTSDNYGKLEKNMVFESKVYQSGIKETEMESFKIITVKKSKNFKKKIENFSIIDFIRKLF